MLDVSVYYLVLALIFKFGLLKKNEKKIEKKISIVANSTNSYCSKKKKYGISR